MSDRPLSRGALRQAAAGLVTEMIDKARKTSEKESKAKNQSAVQSRLDSRRAAQLAHEKADKQVTASKAEAEAKRKALEMRKRTRLDTQKEQESTTRSNDRIVPADHPVADQSRAQDITTQAEPAAKRKKIAGSGATAVSTRKKNKTQRPKAAKSKSSDASREVGDMEALLAMIQNDEDGDEEEDVVVSHEEGCAMVDELAKMHDKLLELEYGETTMKHVFVPSNGKNLFRSTLCPDFPISSLNAHFLPVTDEEPDSTQVYAGIVAEKLCRLGLPSRSSHDVVLSVGVLHASLQCLVKRCLMFFCRFLLARTIRIL